MELSEQPDEVIVGSIQAGDAAAFDELMRRYGRPIANFIYRMLGDAERADDVAQEVFARVCQNVGEVRGSASLSRQADAARAFEISS
jgi:RNA polymerase sigma-70 factor (ECF subfamily)